MVAGGGTGDALVYWAAILRDNPNAEIVYIDFSKASKEIAEERIKIRNLQGNVTFYNDSLLNLPNLDIGKFDFINCCGVLHHLEEPKDGIKALESVLTEDGVMSIMLYGKYGRSAYYPFQEIMRSINHDVTDKSEKIKNTRTLLNSLRQDNLFFPTINSIQAPDLDGELYDIFLHSQDKPYNVADIYDLIGSANLKLIEFCPGLGLGTRQEYKPEKYINDEVILSKIKSLNTEEKQIIAEVMHSKIKKHCFYLSKNDRKQIQLDLDVIPSFSVRFPIEANMIISDIIKKSPDIVSISLEGFQLKFKNSLNIAEIISAIDGKTSLRDILKKIMVNSKHKINLQDLLQEFRPVYELMHDHYWLFLRKPNLPEYENITTLHSKIG